MVPLSPKTVDLIVCTLVLGGSFYLGIFFYPYTDKNSREIAVISVSEFRPQLENSSSKDLAIQIDKNPIIVKSDELKKWIEPYTRNYSNKNDLRISFYRINEYLESIAPRLNVEPINAKFTFRGKKAEVFVPSVRGKKLNITRSTAAISSALLGGQASVSLDFDIIEPETTLEKINDLGIRTILARGESDYGKSSLARIHNIKVGLAKFNGIILKPGEEFSFNSLLGEIDEKSDYQAEFVIKNGALVREYGGGLCQVATTIFRAAILGGLEIKERKPHSFPVQYYNPQGFDATIYPGIVDLKFINNTKNHILIQSKLTGSKLGIEIYGSNDGQKVKIEGPFQYDQRPSGAMKAYFVRKIYLDDGLEKEERFDSVYKAPPPHPEERNPLE